MINQIKNTRSRVQPVTGTRLKDNQIILQIYRKTQLTIWQQAKGMFIHE